MSVLPRKPETPQTKDIIEKSKRVLQLALTQSGRSNFIRQYLYLLWPEAQGILLALARQIGGEIKLPDGKTPLLAVCLRHGAANFYERKRYIRYNPATWDHNVFVFFFQGLLNQAAEIFDCRVSTAAGSCWEAIKLPYLDWRLHNPGEIEVYWPAGGKEASDQAAVQLFRLVLGDHEHRHIWTVNQLINLLGGDS